MPYKLTPKARETLERLVTLMMEMNAAGPAHSGTYSTYGALYEAVVRFLAAETSLHPAMLRCLDYNWGGNHSFAEDVEVALSALTT